MLGDEAVVGLLPLAVDSDDAGALAVAVVTNAMEVDDVDVAADADAGDDEG
jgi:hypothetical protein